MMRDSFVDRASKYIKGHRRKQRRHYFMRAISAIVVFCTVYSLILPAISMEQRVFCDLIEHKHDETCYERRLICGYTETAPAETLLATAAAGETLPDTTAAGEATAPAQAHVHTDACYEQTLICEKQEHTHSLSCYADPNADVESADVWARSVAGVTLSGNWAADLAAVAASQLGYRESEKNYQVAEDGVTVKGYTRYGDWYGDPYGDWSAMFVSFCLNYAGVPQSAVPQESDCSRWVQALTQCGLYYASDYEPDQGDLVFFDRDGDGMSDHVGVITGATKDESGHVTQISTVEGDSAGCVQRGSYNLSQSVLSGFASLPQNPNAPAPTVPETTAVETVPEITVETVPEVSKTETVGNIPSALPSKTPSAELQAVSELKLNEAKTVYVSKGKTAEFRFTPAYSHEYVFESTGDSDTCAYLYDASGRQLAYNNDGGNGSNFRISYNLTAGTTYSFGVKFYRSTKSGNIPVFLSLGTHKYEEHDAGQFACNCGASAQTGLELDQQMDVDVAVGGTVGIQFTPEHTHSYALDVASTVSSYAYLCDASGKQLTSRTGTSFSITYTLTAGATYYLQVKTLSADQSGTFSLLRRLTGHTYTVNEEGSFVCNCGVVEEPLSGLKLDEQMNVDVAAGQIARIRFTPEISHEYAFNISSDASSYAYLYDASGKQLTSKSGTNFSITYTLNAETQYYFGVKYSSTSTSGTIPVLLSIGSSHTYHGLADSGRIVCDCGASLYGASGLELDKPMDVQVPAQDIAYLPFTPTMNHAFVFEIQSDAYTACIFDAKLNLLSESTSEGNGSNSKITYNLYRDTTYYFGIKNNGSDSGMASVLLSLGEHVYYTSPDMRIICNCGKELQPLEGLTPDVPMDVPVEGQNMVYLPFRSTVRHQYVFEAKSDAPIDVYLCNTYLDVTDSQSSGSSGAVTASYDLYGQTTYYFGIRYSSSDDAGTISISLTPVHKYTNIKDGQLICDCGAATDPDPASSLQLTNRTNLDMTGTTVVYYPFIPAMTHYYIFQTLDWTYTYGYIYDADGNLIASDERGYRTITITCALTADTTYFFGIRYAYDNIDDPMGLSLTLGDHIYHESEGGEVVCDCGYKPPSTGECADGTFWRYADGVLTIFGSGAVPNYSSRDAMPWYNFRNAINRVVVEDGVTSIGSHAFWDFKHLTDVTIQGTAAIKNYAFDGCTGLSRITLQGGGSIEQYAFCNCDNLTSVNIQGDVSIGSYAFSDCGNLASVTIQGNSSIGSYAFNNCDSLTDLTLSDALNSIGDYAFSDCGSLASVTIPSSVTSFGENAFSNCDSLTGLTLSDGLESIGSYAFSDCGSLASVTIPSSVTSIGEEAFSNCSSLTDVVLSDGLKSIGTWTFANCTNLAGIALPDSLTSIGAGVFSNCDGLTDISIPGSVTSIGSAAFRACDSLTSVTLPDGLTSIDSGVFSGCTSLTDISIPDSVTSIGSEAFAYSGLTSITIPSSVTSFGYYPFGNCDDLTTVVFQEGTTSIRSYALSKCDNLTNIVIPDSVTAIEANAFYNSTLESFTIPESITDIEKNAFNYSIIQTLRWNAKGPVNLGKQGEMASKCKVIVGKGADVFLGEYLMQLVNMGCTELEFEKPNSITLNALDSSITDLPLSIFPESRYYIDSTGIFYRISESGEAYVAYCPPEAENVIIPGSIPGENDGETFPVVGVDSYAFVQSPISELTFAEPEKITVLRDFAFYGAKNLASINGKTTDTEILEVMNHPREGALVFAETKIDFSITITNAPLTETKNNVDLTITTASGGKHPPAAEGDSSFLNYTGETATSTITVYGHNTASDTGSVIRIYFFRSNEQAAFNYAVGDYELVAKSGVKYAMHISETGLPNCYCVELQCPNPGDTYSVDLTSVYPSPESGGGSLTVWGGILTADEKTELGTAMLPTKTIHLIKWDTLADDFPVTKTGPSALKMVSDGNGGAIVQSFSYSITMIRSGSTLEGIGKDYVTSVDFEDTFTLPDGAALSEDVYKAIQEKNYKTSFSSYDKSTEYVWFSLPDGTKFMEIKYYSSGVCPVDPSLAIRDQDLILRWRANNNVTVTEIPALEYQVKLYDGTVTIPQPRGENPYTFENRVTATQHYTYSADKVTEAGCSHSVSVSAGSIALEKGIRKNAAYMGEPITFTLAAWNPGVAIYEHMATLKDSMDARLYLSAEQIAALFADDPTHDLTIAIHDATLCTTLEKQTVTAINGYSQVIPPFQNVGATTDYSGMAISDPNCLRTDAEITLAWSEANQIQISVGDQSAIVCDPTASAIQDSLDSIGFLITSACRYDLIWNHTDESGAPRILTGGQRIEKAFTATVKDSFMCLNQDQRHVYSSTSYAFAFANELEAYDENGILRQSDSASDLVATDFSLSKGWSIGSQNVTEETPMGQGTVLDYALKVNHRGNGSYDALPLVDHLSGAQALLVNKSWNASEAWAASCSTVSVEGTEYYLLREPGTYSRVWTSQTQMADTVTVTVSSSGLDTIIKWYFSSYTGSRTDTVTYQSMVCPQDLVPGALSYFLWNQTWLSDHMTHRLYDDLPGLYHTSFSFDKKIVQAVGDTSPGETYSLVHEGDTVFYRLSLTSYRNTDGIYTPLTLTGKDLYDVLPGSVADFRWSKENIKIDYKINSGNGNRIANEGSWSVTEAENDLQRIEWGDDFSITFQGTVNIYVTLTYPTGEAWQSYAAQYGAETLRNTFHALTGQASVIHDLSVPVSARLQKGVFASGGEQGNLVSMSGQTDARFHYSDNAHIQYYVSLYNGGVGRLYLTEIWDRLPKGFSWDSWPSDSSFASVYCANGDTAKRILMRSECSIETAKDGTQLLRFRLFQDRPGDANYDARRGLYFLNPGESIVFSYVCNTGDAANTTERAQNTVSMPYYDYTGKGVTVDTGSKTVVANSATYTPNDGGCTLENNSQALVHGFTGGTSITQWLTSEVTVTRGEIRPGITKSLTSATDSYGVVTQNPTSVNSLDLLTWTVTAENDGSNRITDYVLTDVMQGPYMFTGKVSYSSSNYLSFTISETENPDELEIRYVYYQNYTDTATLRVGGEPIELRYGIISAERNCSVWLAISRDENGNAVMSIRIPGDRFSIPAGGRGVLTLRTKNATNVLENRQFLNTCFITPLSQSWDGRTNKGNVVDLETPFHEGALPSVRNSAPVTTAFGYITSSEKQVAEVERPENTAASKSTPNFIVLERNDSLFRYTLSVDNSAEKSMENLILIDSLPEPNDHTVFLKDDLRFSDFKVSLADEPSFVVTVTNRDSGSTVLDPNSYSIQYSTQTEFTDSDWDGSSTWSGTPGEARSLRLVIKDPTGVLIPQKSTVSLSFTCKIDGDAEPGQIAWNSFGYHYKLVGETVELESAPLKVGVKTPSVPMLQKQLADHAGQPILAETDQTFAFLLYEGSPLETTYETTAQLLTALDDAQRAYREFSLSVPAGQSASDAIFLRDSGWVWVDGQTYTLVELPTGKEYGLYGFDGAERTAYSFVYNKAEDKVITCENTGLRWSVELTKTNTAGEILPGAVFALYSPAAEDLIAVPTAYASLNVPTEIDRNGSKWYLKAVGTTDDAGKLYWDRLYQENYYLLEIKAPDGYNLPEDGWLLESENETQGLYTIGIVNTASHALPMTGGSGTNLYTAGGALLIACAGILLLYSKKKRKKEDLASS